MASIDLERMLDVVSVGIVVHEADGRIAYANAAAGAILGFTPAALRARPPELPWDIRGLDGELVPPPQLPAYVALTTGERFASGPLDVGHPDGTRTWVIATATPLPGAPRRVAVSFMDATAERTRFEEARAELARAERRTAAVLHAMPGLVFQFAREADGAGAFPFVGGQLDALAALRGATAPIDVETVRALIHPDDLPAFQAALERSRARLAMFDHLVRVRVAAGVRWLRLRAAPELTATGTLWTGVALDVTEEQLLAEAVRRAQRRDAMGDLAAGIAHNFNNMLAVVLPNVEAARELAPAAEELLRDAQTAATRATELVKQLLLLARGTTQPQRGTADLVAVVRDAASLCRRTFDRAIAIDTVIAPDLDAATTQGSAGHLVQAVVNLCINARDALVGRPAPRVGLTLARVDAPLGDAAAHYAITVTDNGSGMSPDTVARLGEPFFTTKPPGHGTGLGLATVYGTLRDLGGAVEVTSTPCAGTTFTLRCPARAPAVTPAHATAPVPTTAARRVLVVDDEELVRRIVRRQLERHGHAVIEAPSGAAALDLLAHGAGVDVILLDLSMPGMPGAEALRQIRARPDAPPVIIVSGDATPGPHLAGAAAVLQKPASRRTLLAAIDAATDAEAARPGAPDER